MYARMSGNMLFHEKIITVQIVGYIHSIIWVKKSKKLSTLFVHTVLWMFYNKIMCYLGIIGAKEEYLMKTILILGVCLAFLTAIFTAGYNDKPEVKK
jgi:uncharacterized membrane protein